MEEQESQPAETEVPMNRAERRAQKKGGSAAGGHASGQQNSRPGPPAARPTAPHAPRRGTTPRKSGKG